MIFLVTGATGFVGRAICEELIHRRFLVRGAVRDLSTDLPGECAVKQVGDIGSHTDWSDALQGVDVVLHLAARVHVIKDGSIDPLAEYRKINVLGAENLARQAVRAGIKRLVYVSSIKVNGEETKSRQSYSEINQPSPQDPYGISKWEAEQALQRVAAETGLEVVIIRPPLVYGIGVKGNLAQMLSAVSRRIPLPFAAVRNQRSLIYVGNLVDALISCSIHPAAAGKTYLVCDGEDISTPELLNSLGDEMGRPARLFQCPMWLLSMMGKIAGRSDQLLRLTGSLQIDSHKICSELNWKPPYRLQQGLQKTAQWYRDTHQ